LTTFNGCAAVLRTLTKYAYEHVALPGEANAAFIVRANNAHDNLVADHKLMQRDLTILGEMLTGDRRKNRNEIEATRTSRYKATVSKSKKPTPSAARFTLRSRKRLSA
jgi:cob(I)alamin adenosyltransferase